MCLLEINNNFLQEKKNTNTFKKSTPVFHKPIIYMGNSNNLCNLDVFIAKEQKCSLLSGWS